MHLVRRRSGLFVVLVTATAVLLGASLASCREPTQVTVSIITDVPCSQLRGVTITVGHLGEIETKDPALNTTFCDEKGNVGTLVVVPSGADDEQVAIRAVAGNGKDPEQCVAPAYGQQCIVARRALRYLPHASLTIPIALRVTCDGIPCGPTETCVKGLCRSAVIGDPEKCRDGCDEDTLDPPTGSDNDGGSNDGSIDRDGSAGSRDGGPGVFGSGGACEEGGAYESQAPWPVLGGCSSHRGQTDALGPTATPTVKWKRAVGFTTTASSSSSPVVGGDDTIYISGTNLCALFPDGGLKWDAGSESQTTPIVAANAVLHIEDMSVVARKKEDGTVIWTAPPMYTNRCSPVLGRDGTIYGSGSGSFLGAIDSAGKAVFGFQDATMQSAPVYASPGVGSATVYWSLIGGNIMSSFPDGGNQWTTAFSTGPMLSMHVVGRDGTLYMSTGNTVYATNPDKSLKWQSLSGTSNGLAPALGAGDAVLISFTDPSDGGATPTFVALDPGSGSILWKFLFDPADGSGGIPVVDRDGTAYVGTSKGAIYAIATTGAAIESDAGIFRTGVLKWKLQLAPGVDLGAPLAMGRNGTIYAAGRDGSLYAIGN